MSQSSFLTLVRRNGRYRSDGEASRAAYAVFGTIKVWLTPSASDQVRQALPRDAANLWQFSPAPFGAARLHKKITEQPGGMVHFILKIQQLGGYQSHEEARGAACSVIRSLAKAIPDELGRFVGQTFAAGAPVACPALRESRAA